MQSAIWAITVTKNCTWIYRDGKNINLSYCWIWFSSLWISLMRMQSRQAGCPLTTDFQKLDFAWPLYWYKSYIYSPFSSVFGLLLGCRMLYLLHRHAAYFVCHVVVSRLVCSAFFQRLSCMLEKTNKRRVSELRETAESSDTSIWFMGDCRQSTRASQS